MIEKELLLDRLINIHTEDMKFIIRISQGESKSFLDTESLNTSFMSLPFNTSGSILSEDEWYELIFVLTPDIYDLLNFDKIKLSA